MTAIVGLDPSLRATGWAILEIDPDQNVNVRWGVAKPPTHDHLTIRLGNLRDQIAGVVEQALDGAPFEAAMESPFVGHNPQTGLLLGAAQGVCTIALLDRQPGLKIQAYSPATIKRTITGSGKAQKEAVRAAVVARLGLNRAPESLDASDAIAVAYTHFLHQQPAQ